MKRWSTLFRSAFLRARLPGWRTARRGIRTVRRGRFERSINQAKGPAAQESGLDSAYPGKVPLAFSYSRPVMSPKNDNGRSQLLLRPEFQFPLQPKPDSFEVNLAHQGRFVAVNRGARPR